MQKALFSRPQENEPQVTVTISAREFSLLLSAVSAVTPIGGGSDQLCLLTKIANQAPHITESDELTGYLQTVAADEYRQAIEGE